MHQWNVWKEGLILLQLIQLSQILREQKKLFEQLADTDFKDADIDRFDKFTRKNES